MANTLSIEDARQIDGQWLAAGMPDIGLRLVSYRTSGNGSTTLLTVPGDDQAPTYERRNGHFVHVSGPTIEELPEPCTCYELPDGRQWVCRTCQADAQQADISDIF